jgi:hypothetical protein
MEPLVRRRRVSEDSAHYPAMAELTHMRVAICALLLRRNSLIPDPPEPPNVHART